MRLLELVTPRLITENVQPVAMASDGISIEQVTMVADYIKKNCSQWLNETDGGRYTFFRGLKENMASYLAFVQRVRTDREPRDSIQLGHDAYNAVIEAVGGTANRSNSVFALSSYSQAKSYGAPRGQASIIFPIGNYSYTWSKAWDDWNIDDIDTLESFVGRYVHQALDIRGDAEYALEELLDMLEHEATNARTEADRKDIEDEIRGLETWQGKQDFIDEYIESNDGIETAYEVYTDPNNYDKEALSQIIMVDQGLTTAAELKHEVMIHCENVLYIDHQFYEFVWSALHGQEPDLSILSKGRSQAAGQ